MLLQLLEIPANGFILQTQIKAHLCSSTTGHKLHIFFLKKGKSVFLGSNLLMYKISHISEGFYINKTLTNRSLVKFSGNFYTEIEFSGFQYLTVELVLSDSHVSLKLPQIKSL